MELTERLEQLKTLMVEKGLDSSIDTINEVIELLKFIPTVTAPTGDDFFPLKEATEQPPIVFNDCSVYIGDEIILKSLEKFISTCSEKENEEQSPPGEVENLF